MEKKLGGVVGGEAVNAPSRTDSGRLLWVDAARGVALLMMVLYHLVYDLDTFGGYGLESTSGFWGLFADTTAALFVFLVGLSLSLSFRRWGEGRRGLYRKYLGRGARILLYGMLITLVSWALGMGLIVFGILHLIGASIILAYPFLRLGYANAVLGLLLLGAGAYVQSMGLTADGFGALLLPFGVVPEGLFMPDYRPLLPWFGVVLLGLAAGNALRARPEGAGVVKDDSQAARPLAFLGRYSLFIYLVHQPLLIATLLALGIVEL